MDLWKDSTYQMPHNLFVWAKINDIALQKNQIINLNKVQWDSRYIHSRSRSNLADCPAKLEDLPQEARILDGNLWWLGKAGAAVKSAINGTDERTAMTGGDIVMGNGAKDVEVDGVDIALTNDPPREAKEKERVVMPRELKAPSITASQTQSRTLSAAPSVTVSSTSISQLRPALVSGRKVNFNEDESDEKTDYEVGGGWVTSVRTISCHSDQMLTSIRRHHVRSAASQKRCARSSCRSTPVAAAAEMDITPARSCQWSCEMGRRVCSRLRSPCTG